ncbi:recombinase family protein [Kitasatospora sp. NBC_00240]|uniref:recombinase family protein n=1 Tax=Kitasatospora sp. NBC_00240 TaxID=2903567 RepID=UPI002259FCEC|nr:recombinase family protein [Kitasatospora sp. NBC_00240]MCX5208312.1 recombinase family protein [Kitasatospora sp. NBC_00240]
MHTSDPFAPLQPAAYLRRPLHGPTSLETQRDTLRRFAACLGMPAPALYLDNLPPADSRRPRPQFEALVHAMKDGSHHVLLIPGSWVFSSDEYRARLAHQVLTAAGCRRILTLPTPLATIWRRRADAGQQV